MHGLHSLQFPPGQSPVVSKIYIYYGNVPLEFTVPPLPVSCFNRSVFLDKLSNLVENQKTIGLTCRLMVEGLLKSLLLRSKITTPLFMFSSYTKTL